MGCVKLVKTNLLKKEKIYILYFKWTERENISSIKQKNILKDQNYA